MIRSLLCAFLLIATAATRGASEAPLLSAAVLDFADGEPALAGTGASVAALVQAKLSAEPSLVLVERAELGKILAEQELSLSGAVSPAQAVKVGLLTGAEVIVSGRTFAVQTRTHLVAKVISTASGRVFGATVEFDQGGRMDGAADELAAKVAALLKEKAADLRSGKSLEETQLEKVKASLTGRPAPKVSVSIKESVLAAAVPDPAAQTELRSILHQAGCTLVEKQDEADLILTGEAVAETGVRRGQLWFTRARLEFTLKNHAGSLLTNGRVVAGNIDLAQHIACKGALQKVGLLASSVAADAWMRATTPNPTTPENSQPPP